MAYRFDGTDDDVRFSPGAFTNYTAGPITAAALIKRNATGSWDGIITLLDAAGGDSSVLIDLLEIDNANHFAFWNGETTVSGTNGSIDGSTTGTLTDTANWYIVAVSWGGNGTAPKFHWKQLGAGSWTHQAIADGTGRNALQMTSSDRIIVGTDPTGADDLAADVVWAGMSKSNDADATIETLDTLDFADIEAYGFEWLVGFEASETQTDRTGGGGNEVSTSGTTLVSDPSGWTWGGGVTESLAATIAAVSSVSGALSVSDLLAAVIAGTSTVAGAVSVSDLLQATIAGTSTVAAALTDTPTGGSEALAALIAGVSGVSADVSVTDALAATIAGVSGVSGDVSVSDALAAAIGSTSSVAAAASVISALSAQINSVSGVSAVATVIDQLQAVIAGTSSIAASLTDGDTTVVVVADENAALTFFVITQ